MDKRPEKPSAYTILYWLIQDKKIEPNVLFSFVELFWPKFIEKDGYVFLKEKYSEEEFFRLLNQKSDPEYWINFLTVDDFFSELEDGEGKSKSLAKILAEIWGIKLKKDFPEIEFSVKCLSDEEYGDCGLTFYQKIKK